MKKYYWHIALSLFILALFCTLLYTVVLAHTDPVTRAIRGAPVASMSDTWKVLGVSAAHSVLAIDTDATHPLVVKSDILWETVVLIRENKGTEIVNNIAALLFDCRTRNTMVAPIAPGYQGVGPMHFKPLIGPYKMLPHTGFGKIYTYLCGKKT